MQRRRLTPRWADGGDPIHARTLFGAQLFMVAAVSVPVVSLAVTSPEVMRDVTFMVAAGMLGLATIAVGAVGLDRDLALVGWCLAIVDLLACLGMYASAPSSGFGAVMIIPVALVAALYVKPVAAATTVLAIAGVGVGVLAADTQRIPSALSIMVLMALVAGSTHALSNRVRVQQILLVRQASMLNAAVTRAKVHESTLGTVLDALDSSVSALEHGGEVLLTNRATTAMARRVGGSGPWLPGLDDPMRRIVEGEDLDGELVWAGQTGAEQLALNITSRRVVLDGADHAVVVIMRDVTSDVLAQRARDQFVASVTHEFRTPLTSIIGYLDLVRDDDLSPDTHGMLTVAAANAERLLVLTNDFLEGPAKSETTDFSLHLAPCRPFEVIEQAVESIRPSARARGIVFVLGPLDDAVIRGDAGRLRQVFDNLVSNAVKYNVDGGSVWIQVQAELDHVVVTVRDSGRGMSDHEVTQMFNRYFRGRQVRDSAIAGTGLGMDISRVIIEQHGGVIEVSSTVGAGTTVTVRLPTTGPIGDQSVSEYS